MAEEGKWNRGHDNIIYCSECKRTVDKEERFCPECGAKMYPSDLQKAKEIATAHCNIHRLLPSLDEVFAKEDEKGYDVLVFRGGGDHKNEEGVRIRVDADFKCHCEAKYILHKGERRMKNAKETQLKKVIHFGGYEEFKEVLDALDGEIKYVYDAENGFYLCSSEMGLDEIFGLLAEYFGVTKVTSIHSDDSDLEGVWIVYED